MSLAGWRDTRSGSPPISCTCHPDGRGRGVPESSLRGQRAPGHGSPAAASHTPAVMVAKARAALDTRRPPLSTLASLAEAGVELGRRVKEGAGGVPTGLDSWPPGRGPSTAGTGGGCPPLAARLARPGAAADPRPSPGALTAGFSPT